MRLKIRQTGGDRLKAHVRKVKRDKRRIGREAHVEVGFHETAKYQDGTPVAAVAAWQNFGVDFPERAWVNIPPRPFFSDAIRKVKNAIRTIQRDWRGTNIVRKLNLIGRVATDAIKREIREGDFPDNSEQVRLRKERKTEPGTDDGVRPLIDTGHMRASVDYVVKLRQ